MELAPRFEAAAISDGNGSAHPVFGPGGGTPGGPHEASAADRAAQREELRAALGSLGYGTDEVRQVLARLPVEGTTEDMLRYALRELAGNP
jgi:RuvA, C-terminal domain